MAVNPIFFSVKYFLHDTSSFDDDKIGELFMTYGYEGLGLFYTILEKIAKQEKPIKTSVLKSQLRVGKKLEKCWEFMESLGLIQSNNGETFNLRLLSYSEKYAIKKQKNKERVSQFRENQQDTENVTHYKEDCNAPKVKESKVKESKVNTPTGYREVWDKWLDYKKTEHREYYKTLTTEQAAFDKLLEYSMGDPQLALKIIDQSISNRWKGIFQIKENDTNKGSNRKSEIDIWGERLNEYNRTVT